MSSPPIENFLVTVLRQWRSQPLAFIHIYAAVSKSF